jgi:hypothetical protein
VPLYLDAGEERAVKRAAGDLAQDVERVTGARPRVTQNTTDLKGRLVIIGSLGKSPILDRLSAAGRLDATGLSGAWESFVLQVVKDPLPGVEQALVIAGSDRRGAIYGIYELSLAIGVSPWYYWADVTPRKKERLAIRAGVVRQGPPAVKYRGIFLNDEDWGLRPWAAETLEPETGNIGPKTYAHIFELLLRLRGNFLWPAMHQGTRAFNFYPQNKELADAYGIVMGSSHCEQMLRDNVDEWKPEIHGEYDYVKNRDGVLRYWEQRVRENGPFESVFTLGMRGIHDSGMPGGGTPRRCRRSSVPTRRSSTSTGSRPTSRRTSRSSGPTTTGAMSANTRTPGSASAAAAPASTITSPIGDAPTTICGSTRRRRRSWPRR